MEVAVIVWLATSELAEREHDRLALVAFAGRKMLPKAVNDRIEELIVRRSADRRHAELRDESVVLALGDLFETGLGDIGKRRVRGSNVVLPYHIANADAQVLGVFEAVQYRVDVFCTTAKFGERFFENRRRGQVLDEQAVHKLVDHARIAGENAGEVRACSAEPYVQLQRRPVEAKQLPQRGF